MRSVGIDIGSRTTKLAVLEDGEIAHTEVVLSTYDPIAVCNRLLKGFEGMPIAAAGYGRRLFKEHFECEVLTEIRAVTLGARNLFPDCRAILDIGGQDTKAISLNGKGSIDKFEMNDKCAAGTGKFLEMTASALSFTMDEFASAARNASRIEPVSSMCTVFAESEIVSKVSRGAARDHIALGIHHSALKRAVSMLSRVKAKGKLLFVGGVALNECMRDILESAIEREVCVPDQPQIVTALGCALFASLS